MKFPSLLVASLFLAASQAPCEVRLPKLFSSHMVLQREMPIHIWGEADPGEKVTLSLEHASASGVADKLGRWSVYLPARPAGGPFMLSVRAGNTLQLDDILIGDLWVASGQSNMEIPLIGFNPTTQIENGVREIANANFPEIRFLNVKHDVSDYPLEELKAVVGWARCTPASAAGFSAVAYFFAREIQQKQHVAIGLIDSTWGGTPAEAWTSLDALSRDASLMPVFATRAAWMDTQVTEERLRQFDAEAKAQGRVPARRYWHADPLSWRPAGLYNALIAPLTPLAIRGVIWYQGEANTAADMAPFYGRIFSAMIQDWRAQWHQADLPFLFVQLSAYGNSPSDHWGVVRDAQRRTLHLANTGMAVTVDIGDEYNVHPPNKKTVGDRLALLARDIVYKEKIVSSGPLFRLAYPEGNHLHVWFNYATGLNSNGPAESFEVAGADGVFSAATARIEGDTVLVSSPDIAEPRYVRYGWANYSPADHQPNLYNAAGLPAAPFSSYPAP